MSEPSWEQSDPTFPNLQEQDENPPQEITCAGGLSIRKPGAGNGE